MPFTSHYATVASLLGMLCILGMGVGGCAFKVAPTGGPRDSVAAVLYAADPPSGTVDFDAEEIRFSFDDYIDRGIRNSITVLPTKRFNASYAGDEISVAFREPLDSSTTYSVTIGTDWTDVRGNRPREAYTYIFSTGPTIDSGIIQGRVVADNLQNVIVMCYVYADSMASQFNLLRTKAAYIIPVGTTGNFSIKGLSNRRYRVVTCRDENKNSMLDANEDFATSTSDIDVTQGNSRPLLLHLGRAKDHEPPQIARARALTSSLASIEFTESIMPVSTWQNAIRIKSATGATMLPSAHWVSPISPNVLLMRYATPLDSAAYTLVLSPSSIRDSSGTLNADTTVERTLQWTRRIDTMQLRVSKITPPDSAKDVALDTSIRVIFSDAIDTNDAHLSVWHQQPQGSIPVSTLWISPVELEIKATQPRIAKTWYTTSISPDRLVSFSGSVLPVDTIQHAMLTSLRKVELGTVKGSLLADSTLFSSARVFMRLLNGQGSVVAMTIVSRTGLFAFENVPAGEYRTDIFQDINGNQAYGYGDWQPFRFSEPWWPIEKKVLVRSRWTLEDVTLDVTTR
ncbi:MAG: hypothetical protein FJ211_08925 [Ignavibacteria bacterium]|nr:hypothetical protein [Ignavibacteria bacterium]